jgi:hypothetical protein
MAAISAQELRNVIVVRDYKGETLHQALKDSEDKGSLALVSDDTPDSLDGSPYVIGD